MEIEKTSDIGFCFGVRRAIEILEKSVRECGSLETLGAVVHNEQVLQRLNRLGIRVVESPAGVTGGTVAISSHGVSPEVEKELRAGSARVIDTTCPSVRRAQEAARKLAEEGYRVVVYGDARHPEVKGILGWAGGKGLATLDLEPFKKPENIPRRLGILAQTTQIREKYLEFVRELIGLALHPESDIRILYTLCSGTRQRQAQALELAGRSDLVLVVGGKASANTRRLFELCSSVTETHWIQQASDIDPAWLRGKKHVGITSGTSTPEESIDEVIKYIERIKP